MKVIKSTQKKQVLKKSTSYGSGQYVTWSKEYSHLGLQRYYLIVKSYQDLQIWSLLERSYHAKVLKTYQMK